MKSSLLTLAEQRFVPLYESEYKLLRLAPAGEDTICGGATADLGAPENDPANAHNWRQDRTIRAELLQWLCFQRNARKQIHPFGIRVIAARVEGKLDISYSTIPFPLVFRACWWPDGIALQGTSLPELCLTKCWVGPLLALAEGDASRVPAMVAYGMQVKGSVFLDRGFRAEGEVNLVRAEIGGNLECNGASLKNAKGLALRAGGANIGRAVMLGDNFLGEGEVRLLGARVGGNLNCDDGSFKNRCGDRVAFNAEGAKIGRGVLLRNKFHADGEVRLRGAEIGEDLDCQGAILKNAKLKFQRASIKGALNVTGMRTGAETEVDLSDASCNVLIDCPKSWPPNGNLRLDGFVYQRIGIDPPWSAKSRLEWLERQLPPEPKERRGRFRPQPYRQLAGVLYGQGHDADAKAILISMAKDRQKWGDLSWRSRSWHRVMGATLGYGYRPFRPLVLLSGLWVLGSLLFGAGYWAYVMVPANKDVFPDFAQYHAVPGWYEPFSPVVYAIDAALPVISLGQRDRWLPDAAACNANAPVTLANQVSCDRRFEQGWRASARTALAAILPLYRWFHIAAGWILATLLVAGITGLVKND
jgi:hypothetical protein